MSDMSDSDDRLSCSESRPAPRCRPVPSDSGSIVFHMAFAAFVRFSLLFYGVFHDQVFRVKYTDVDYTVFTDAARFVRQGRSPFLRDGYRYTPLIAFLMLPNLHVALFGKLLFLAADLLTGCLIHRILTRLTTTVRPGIALLCTLTWLYNPLPLVVSTRGSSDSIQTLLVLAVFSCLMVNRIAAAGLLFGLAIHVKVYPVIYAPAIYLLLAEELPNGVLLSHRLWNPFCWKRMSFSVCALISFCSSTALCWHLYEDRYVSEAWIYHIRRKDVQHNFSVYFYLYHVFPLKYHNIISSLAFLPQMLAVIVISVRSLTAVASSSEQHFTKFLCVSFHVTFLFVSLNKVITSQYFLWYLCLLPFVLPHVPALWTRENSDEFAGNWPQSGTERGDPDYWFSRTFLILTMVWMAGQVIWLLPAYLYEFKHWEKSLVFVWIASIAFLAINLVIAVKLSPCFHQLNKKKDC